MRSKSFDKDHTVVSVRSRRHRLKYKGDIVSVHRGDRVPTVTLSLGWPEFFSETPTQAELGSVVSTQKITLGRTNM